MTKQRAQRDQDVEDIKEVIRKMHKQINFDVLRRITESDTEYDQIQAAVRLWKNR